MTSTQNSTAGRLAGKHVLVVGRGDGIAQAVALAAVAHGAQVTVAGRGP